MIIISAGVVMNLITGVLFAAVAYMYGVPYMPAVVGNVTPGGPAIKLASNLAETSWVLAISLAMTICISTKCEMPF